MMKEVSYNFRDIDNFQKGCVCLNKYSLAFAKEKDQQDQLAKYRKEFYLRDDLIYLDGNSLGLLSKRAEQSLNEVIQSWKEYAIDGWTEGKAPWYYMAETIGARMAKLVGAKKAEVIASNSTTVNLHQILATFFQPKEGKNKIIADELNFPSDIYAIKSHLRMRGYSEEHFISIQSRDGQFIREEDIIAAMDEEVALIILPSVLYRSGQILQMKRLVEEAHKREILIGFDLCHSIGAIPHSLTEWNVDFAFWCNYKHLNGGPGAVGGLYINERHHGTAPGLAGWFGSHKQKQFDMEHEMTLADDASAYQMGTPQILSMAPLLGALSMFDEVGIEAIREKSLQLTEYMMILIHNELKPFAFQLYNRKDESRGAHILLGHREAARICKALKAEGIIPDFRMPDGIRLAPVSLYNSFEDVWRAISILKKIMEEETYKKFENKRGVIA